MNKETWYQVKFANPKTGMSGAIRVFNKEECDKLENLLPSIGLAFAGYDIIWAESAEAVLEKLKTDLQLSTGATVVPLKVV